jgi:hypothetical protein
VTKHQSGAYPLGGLLRRFPLDGGASNADIARTLGIKAATVRSHIVSMRRKLHVRLPKGLLLAAVQLDGNGVQARVKAHQNRCGRRLPAGPDCKTATNSIIGPQRKA